MSRPASRSGFTLIELLVALVLSAVVLGAVYPVLWNNQRFFRAQAEIVGVHQNVRAVAHILATELRQVSAADGDIVAMSDRSVTIKALRGFAVACAAPVSGAVVIRNSLTFGVRGIDPAKDSALVFLEGDPSSAADDRWLHRGIADVAAGATCEDGAAGTRLALGAAGQPSALDSVTDGAPVRTFEVVTYRLYADASGTWWLGVRAFTGGVWSATSPVAGPLRPRDGLALRFTDADGNSVGSPDRVALVDIVVRGRSARPLAAPGRPAGPYEDSLVARVAPRND